MAIALDGTIFVTNAGFGIPPSSVYEVNPLTGDRTILSNPTTGTGPDFGQPLGIAVYAPVPEPSTLVIASVLFGSIGMVRLRKRKA
jgi:hypothetical protein